MDSLPKELLVQIFARLTPSDLGQVGRASARWHDILLDDVLWHKVFLETFGIAPPQITNLTIPMKWRTALMYRINQLRVWGANYDGSVTGNKGIRQLGCYRFKNMGGIVNAKISIDKRSLIIVTKSGIIHGKISSKRHLSRSVLFFEGEQNESQVSSAIISNDGCLLLGYNTGIIKIYDNIPSSSLNTGFALLKLQNESSVEFNLPVCKIIPSLNEKYLCILRRDSFPTSQVALLDLGIRPNNQNKIILNVESNSTNEALWYNDRLYWNNEGRLHCRDIKGGDLISHLDLFPSTVTSITHLFQFGKYIVTTSCGQSNEVIFVSSNLDSLELHVAAKVSFGDSLITSVSYIDEMIILGCSNGFVYRLLPDSDAAVSEERIKVERINQRPFDTEIKCVHVTNLIILVICEDSMIIYDCLGLKLLQSFSIPGKSRRIVGAGDVDPVTGTCNVSVLRIDDKGQILVQWGMQTLHYWNFGKLITELKGEEDSTSTKSPPRTRQQRQADIAVDLREELDAFEDASLERQSRNTLRSEFGLEGMNEEEMIMYAQLLSLHEENNTNIDSVNSEEDPDLALAIRLSLLDNL